MSFNDIIKSIIGWFTLSLIVSGVITHPNQIRGDVDKKDLSLLSACMYLENGNNGDRCLLLTGSVVINRRDYVDWCPNTIEGVLYQKGQYAKETVDNLKSVVVPEHVQVLAKFLLIYGPICPHNVIYQSQQKNLGSDHFDIIDTPDGPEYFAFE